jgi:hypothetical protein
VNPRPIGTAPQNERVLLWRIDRREWDIGYPDHKRLGHPEYAYSHWLPLPEPVTGSPVPVITYYRSKPINSLSREELIAILEGLAP